MIDPWTLLEKLSRADQGPVHGLAILGDPAAEALAKILDEIDKALTEKAREEHVFL